MTKTLTDTKNDEAIKLLQEKEKRIYFLQLEAEVHWLELEYCLDFIDWLLDT